MMRKPPPHAKSLTCDAAGALPVRLRSVRAKLVAAGLTIAGWSSAVLTAQEPIPAGPVLSAPALSPPGLSGPTLSAPAFSAPARTPSPLTSPAQTLSNAPLNLHIVVSEAFLNRYAAREDVQSGEVRDVFQDTPVEGQQITKTRLRVDLIPSQTDGRLALILDGETANTTAGFSRQAVVTSVGHIDFQASKEILFDGYQLATYPARVAVLRFQNDNVGAVTRFTGGPLGPIAEHVVLSVAERRQPAAEAHARERIVQRIAPKFNGEIDKQLSNGNGLLQEIIQPRLKSASLMPERVRVRSSDSHLHFAASLGVAPDVKSLAPAPDELVADRGIMAYVHETFLQGIVDRAGLAGRKFNVKELKERLRFAETSENDRTLGGMPDLDVEIEFAEVDPLVIRVGEDETRVTLRAAFKPAGQELLPPFEITIPYRLELQNDKWILKTGSVDVRSLNGGSDGTSLTERAIKTAIEASLPRLDFPKQLPASATPEGKTPPSVNSIRSGNGWIVVGVD